MLVLLLPSSAYDLKTIMDRGHNYKYLNSALALEEFEEADLLYPFYEEWLQKNNLP